MMGASKEGTDSQKVQQQQKWGTHEGWSRYKEPGAQG